MKWLQMVECQYWPASLVSQNLFPEKKYLKNLLWNEFSFWSSIAFQHFVVTRTLFCIVYIPLTNGNSIFDSIHFSFSRMPHDGTKKCTKIAKWQKRPIVDIIICPQVCEWVCVRAIWWAKRTKCVNKVVSTTSQSKMAARSSAIVCCLMCTH